MNRILYRLISKLNFTNKDKAEFINTLNSSSQLEQKVSNIEIILSQVLEGYEVNPVDY